MAAIGWTRRSSTARPMRVSNQQYALDLGASRGQRRSRSPDRHSKIPLRSSSSQSQNRDKLGLSKQRSKSHATGSTPIQGKITPVQSSYGFNKITPSASSNLTKKKMGFLKDTRNIQSKEFLKEAGFLVQQYFKENCPDALINGSDIKPMTIKMFIAMVNHMFEVLEIVDKGREPVTLNMTSYATELPLWMKKLEYPGQLSKSCLQTVNVPTNWPYVIAFLSWLVKLYTAGQIFKAEEQLDCGKEDLAKYWSLIYFKHSLDGFRYYNEEREDEYKELCNDMTKMFYELNGVNENEIEDVKMEIERLQQNLEDPDAMANKDAYDEAAQRLKNLQAQHQKNIEDITKIEDDIDLKKNKIAKKERNINILKEQIELKKKRIESLKTTVSKQSISVVEIAEIQKKCDYLDKEIKCLEKECEDYSQLISRYDFEAAEKRDKILQSTHIFNRNIIQLEQLIPELKDFHVHMDLENDQIVEEMEKMVKSLEMLKHKYVTKREELENELKGYQKSLDSKKLMLRDLTESIKTLKAKNELKKAENEDLSKYYEEQEKILKAESEKWDAELHEMQEKLKSFEELKEKKKEIEKRRDSLLVKLEKLESYVEKFWSNVYDKWKYAPEMLDSFIDLINAEKEERRKLQASNGENDVDRNIHE